METAAFQIGFTPTGKSLSRGDRIRTCDILVPNQALFH
ncbi:hypothetical protein SEA_RAHEL_155 [Mycobacterium phage Rahel]|nr:hypothetical protein SEA_RAHEL_155 [Mycobacterium phage Rahel]